MDKEKLLELAEKLNLSEVIDELDPSEILDDKSNILTLTDEDGNEREFEFLDLILYNDEVYSVLLPASDDEDEGEVVILKMEDNDEDEEMKFYVPVESEEILDAVFEIFKEDHKDEYDFDD